MAKKVTYTCDKCGGTIHDVVFTLACYAEDVNPGPFGGISMDAAAQNVKQNTAAQSKQTRHLCGKCKDEITDGLFIV